MNTLTKKEFYSAVLGIVLGDGYLRRNKTKYASLSIGHSLLQKEYAKWKGNLLNHLTSITYREDKYFRDEKVYYRFFVDTKSHPFLDRIWRLAYKNGKKRITDKILNRLTPLGIAIWFMDDGTMSIKRERRIGRGLIAGRQMHLCTQSFTEKENKIIQRYFQDKYGIRMNITKTHNGRLRRLTWGMIEGKKFIDLVSPYIHPSMHYKVDPHYRLDYDIHDRKRDWHGRFVNDEKVQRLKYSPSKINWMMK